LLRILVQTVHGLDDHMLIGAFQRALQVLRLDVFRVWKSNKPDREIFFNVYEPSQLLSSALILQENL